MEEEKKLSDMPSIPELDEILNDLKELIEKYETPAEIFSSVEYQDCLKKAMEKMTELASTNPIALFQMNNFIYGTPIPGIEDMKKLLETSSEKLDVHPNFLINSMETAMNSAGISDAEIVSSFCDEMRISNENVVDSEDEVESDEENDKNGQE